jgi:hypothetical protein
MMRIEIRVGKHIINTLISMIMVAEAIGRPPDGVVP